MFENSIFIDFFLYPTPSALDTIPNSPSHFFSENFKMHFFAKSILAIAIVSGGLLSATLAAPTRTQVMHENLSSTVESRQCMDSCAGNGEPRLNNSDMYSRQILSRPQDQQDNLGVQSRQTMLDIGADEGEVGSRQIHDSQMTEVDDTMRNQMDAAWVTYDRALE